MSLVATSSTIPKHPLSLIQHRQKAHKIFHARILQNCLEKTNKPLDNIAMQDFLKFWNADADTAQIPGNAWQWSGPGEFILDKKC